MFPQLCFALLLRGSVLSLLVVVNSKLYPLAGLLTCKVVQFKMQCIEKKCKTIVKIQVDTPIIALVVY